ncbi:hypothetical protein [Paludisphaera soli]|uniref:hypothetical protein n=1 Tax=Paludisphaera soli TaxID=2712865 RepID=UPI0013EC6E3C|nr:hypothetical protein [Paludisphaera soli]
MTPETSPPSTPSARDRRRFLAALALFFTWIACLVALAATDAHRPMERAGVEPGAARPAH